MGSQTGTGKTKGNSNTIQVTIRMKRLILYFIISSSSLTQLSAQNYYVYVTAESEDEVSLIRFDGKKAEAIKTIPVGVWPADIEGPHGLTVSLDKKHWFVSVAHGNPFGTLYKYSTETNELVGKTDLGLFPASMQVSKATGLLYCVNFNLHGDMVPSTVSVVDPETMTELKQIKTGVMPHGSRISTDGMFQYSVGMMSGELFEINTVNLEVSRFLVLDEKEMSMMGGMDHSAMGHEEETPQRMVHSKTKPTWAMPHPTLPVVYVAGNGSDELLEIDTKTWQISHRLKTGKAPYNVDVTPDGSKVVVTYKGEGATGIWDVATRKELAKISNTRKVSHGIAISSDSKYAFISVEGVGGEPGTVDVIDLISLKKISYAELGKQAGGIIFWKMD